MCAFSPEWVLHLWHAPSLLPLVDGQHQDVAIVTLSVSLPYESVRKVETIYSFFLFFGLFCFAEVMLIM